MAQTWGSWRCIRQLGEGGQAHAFLVEHSESEEQGVLKRLKNPGRLGRFRKEVEAGLKLSHANVLKVVDATGLDDTKPWFVTELCKHGALSNISTASISLDARLQLFLGICCGVAHAHEHNVVHRDLKPENIFLADSLTAVVGDFGLCHFTDAGERFTFSDEAVGSRWYIAPELEDGQAAIVTPSVDVYALGKILYWLVTGRIFAREKHRDESFFFASGSSRTSDFLLYEILDKCIVSDAVNRLASAAELAREIETLQRRIAMQAHAVGKDIPQPCAYCGLGSYAVRIDSVPGKKQETAVRNFGLTPQGNARWRILACDYCGNLQFFRLERLKDPDVWSR
jgi:serine/threonine protein kinase